MSGNGSASANLMAVGCNGALGLQQSASAKIFDSRGFASFEVCFKNGRGLSLLQRISFVVLRLRVRIQVLVGAYFLKAGWTLGSA
jgi:hypothetical protein